MKRSRTLALGLGAMAVALLLAACGGGGGTPTPRPDLPTVNPVFRTPTPTTARPTPTEEPMPKDLSFSAPPPLTIDVDKRYFATFETEEGEIRMELFPRKAPRTVNNFVFLAREGFYDNTTFHRVIPNFMAQGGDPTGTGRGGPGYAFEDEFSDLTHVRGAVSMANAGPNTNGSQFFIVYAPAHHLDGRHSVFGLVDTAGMSVVEKLTPGEPPVPRADRVIRVTIEEVEREPAGG